MPIVDLTGKRVERQAQILQMMNQMRNRDMGRDSAMEQFNREYELKLQEEARLQAESNERKRNIGSEITTRQGALDLQTYGAGRKDVHDTEDATRQDKLLGSQQEHLGAQTEAARASAASSRASAKESGARTTNVETDTAGDLAEQRRKNQESTLSRAQGIVNDGIRRLSMGDTLSKEDTDAIQDSQRLLSGNPGLLLPRKPDGSWNAPKNVIRGMVDKNGVPTMTFAKGVEAVDTSHSPYGKMIDDATEARENGAGPEILALWTDKFIKETALNKNQLEYRFAKKFLDVGDYAGAQKILGGLENQKGMQLKLPSVEERQEFTRQLRLVDDMDTMQKQFDDLTKSGRIPVGALKQPFYKILQMVGKDDPEVTTFIKRVEQMKGEYLLYLSGRAATDAERDDINNRIPTVFDSPQTFKMALPQFREKVSKDVSIDAGILHSMGLRIPDNVPIVDPGDILKKDGKLPNLILENGYIPGDYAAQHLTGVGVIGSKIGGQGEFRLKPGDQWGESTPTGEVPPPAAEPGTLPGPAPGEIETDATKYKDPVKARSLLKEREELLRSQQ